MTTDIVSIAGWRGAYGEPRRSKPKTNAERAADFKRALDIRRHSRPIAGTPGETYLRSRGLLPDVVLYGPTGWPASIRWAEDAVRLPTPPVKPGIVIDVQDAATGAVTGIHRIFFRRDGMVEKDASGKKAKIALGAVWGNAAMLDCPPDPEGQWGIAEGVETAMAARQLYRIPVWAAIFGGNMRAITPPPWARSIFIFADRDAISKKGYRPGFKFAADALRLWRWRSGVESVRVLAHRREGADLVDLLQEIPYVG